MTEREGRAIQDDTNREWEIECILAQRTNIERGEPEYKVRWRDASEEEDEWLAQEAVAGPLLDAFTAAVGPSDDSDVGGDGGRNEPSDGEGDSDDGDADGDGGERGMARAQPLMNERPRPSPGAPACGGRGRVMNDSVSPAGSNVSRVACRAGRGCALWFLCLCLPHTTHTSLR